MSDDFVRRLPTPGSLASSRSVHVHIDPVLLSLLLVALAYGLTVLWSASDQSLGVLQSQGMRVALAMAMMLAVAQVSPRTYQRWTPVAYLVGCALLALVIPFGVDVNGSRRWLDLPGLPRFQPSELMKIAVPMMVAWYLCERPLPPRMRDLAIAAVIVAVPSALIVVEPDLGTAILVTAAGAAVVVLAGLPWRWIVAALAAAGAAAPGLWLLMQDYQRQRILTLFDPERDPLGAGWNIIQSTTAIGSGGAWGKGLLQGTQSHLDFLPEASTDFIIAVLAEEFGFVGVLVLIVLYGLIIARGMAIASRSPQPYARLVAGGLTCTFFVYVFVNIAMVSGLLPVVGVPLPLVSYGGTSMLTLLSGFGVLMSIYGHGRRI